MREDILKFRKCVDILINEKGYNKNKISIESKLTWPTLKKIIEAPIDEIKIQASVLGILQDFLKKHCNDINYAGIKPATIIEVDKTQDIEKMKKNLSNYHPAKEVKEVFEKIEITDENKEKVESAVRLSKHPYFTGEKPEEKTIEQPANPFDLFIGALKSIPSNVTVHISINEKSQ